MEPRDTVQYEPNTKAAEFANSVTPVHIKLAGHRIGRTLEVEVDQVLTLLLHQRILSDFGRKALAHDVLSWTSVKVEAKSKLVLGLAYISRQLSASKSWITKELNQLRQKIAVKCGHLAIRVAWTD